MKKAILLNAFFFLGFFIEGYGQANFWLRTDVRQDQVLRTEELFRDSLQRAAKVQQILQGLYAEGYLAPHQEIKLSKSDSLWIEFSPGERFKWVSIKQGNVPEALLNKSGTDLRIFQRRPIDYTQVSRIFESIIQESENRGYPFAAIRLDSIRRESNSFSAALDLDLGPFIRFDTVRITGDSKTKPMFLGKLMQIRPGDPFSQKKIQDGTTQIGRLPYLRWSGTPELSFQNEEASLYLPLNDRKTNTIDGIIGFLPNELDGNRLLITGQFDLVLNNVGGRGRQYELHWLSFNRESQNLQVSAFEPLLLGSPIDLGVSFFLLKEDSTFLNRDFRVDLGYRMGSSGYLKVFSRRQAGDLLSTGQLGEVTALPEVGDFRFNNYGLQFVQNWLDDGFFPRRGVLGKLEAAIGNKVILQNAAFPPELYEGVNMRTLQYYTQASIEKHLYLNPSWGFYGKLTGGLMENENLFINDLFRLGGLRTIRGFNENFFFANRYWYLNLEPRYYFDTYSYFMIFADVGNLENKLSGLPSESVFSAGIGFSLETSNGIFNFIYALGGSRTQDFALNLSKIHFGYTGRF